MGKPDETNEEVILDQETAAEAQPEDDAEGHLFLPGHSGAAQSLAGDREREVERRLRDREREKEARDFKQGRVNRP